MKHTININDIKKALDEPLMIASSVYTDIYINKINGLSIYQARKSTLSRHLVQAINTKR